MREFLDRRFALREHGTLVSTEIVAGLTTFVAMAYIIFVNPAILALSGMDRSSVFVATVLSTALATLIMGLYANVPFAQAPGMGLNAFFTFTVVLIMGFTWQQALAIVFLCGVFNFIIVITRIRKMLIIAIPEFLQHAIGGGIGLFIAYIGLKNAHFLDFTMQGTDLLTSQMRDGQLVLAVSRDVVPSLAKFNDPVTLLALIGVVVIIALLLMRIRGAILLGIILTTIVGIFMGVTHLPKLAARDFFPPSILPTLFKLDIAGLFADPHRIVTALSVILAYSLADTFDTIGTFIGTGRRTGIFDEADAQKMMEAKGYVSKMDRALFSDGIATSIGALLGTSNVTSYVESAAGISAGGRTGLTSVATAVCFLLCLFVAPLALMIPASATAAALIIVGILMMESVVQVRWDRFEEAAAAFFTLVMMPFTYSIANGVAAGFIVYVVTMIIRGRAREVHPLMYIVTALFIVNFILQAFR